MPVQLTVDLSVGGEISMNEMQAHQPEPSSDIAAEYQDQLEQIRQQIATVIVGQQPMVEAMLCAMLSRGHILLEGVPGLAKSLAVATFSRTIGGDYNRIQFTPDKLPSDITGTMVYDERENNFVFHPGPVFCNILLADEINRASPKVQSALLEAMQEQAVSVDSDNYPCQNSSWFWRRKTPSSNLEPIRSLRLSLIASWQKSIYPTLNHNKKKLC